MLIGYNIKAKKDKEIIRQVSQPTASICGRYAGTPNPYTRYDIQIAEVLLDSMMKLG